MKVGSTRHSTSLFRTLFTILTANNPPRTFPTSPLDVAEVDPRNARCAPEVSTAPPHQTFPSPARMVPTPPTAPPHAPSVKLAPIALVHPATRRPRQHARRARTRRVVLARALRAHWGTTARTRPSSLSLAGMATTLTSRTLRSAPCKWAFVLALLYCPFVVSVYLFSRNIQVCTRQSFREVYARTERAQSRRIGSPPTLPSLTSTAFLLWTLT